jgi:hypothetical protein
LVLPWKPEYAERRRAKYKADAAERERRKLQGRKPEENAKYMREYFRANPEKRKRTPEQAVVVNDRRRERYATDVEYRETCKKSARQRPPHKRREGRLLKQFGISAEQYERMLAEQGGTCALCPAVLSDGRGHMLAVDHCHATGRVRGLLCINCNQGLGKFGDDPKRLRRAADYLERARLLGNLV